MSDKQEYLYNSEYVTIAYNVEGDDDLIVVENDHGSLEVARKSSLTKKEESYYFKRAQERKEELESITRKARENLDKIADRVVDKALIALSSRMKFNAVFGKDMGSTAGWAVMIANELEKMVKEKAKEETEKFES